MSYDKEKEFIDDFESNKISSVLAVQQINRIGYYGITEHYLKSDCSSIDVDEFSRSIITPEIKN